MSIRAMVMAAGAGTRLLPLTQAVPKPMVPIANRPVLEYTILNLKRHGIVEIILNLHHLPGQIRDYFGDGQKWGVHLSYSPEIKLLGTAGGVRRAGWFLKRGTFLVTSGDGLTDIDFTALVNFHKAKGSAATLALKKVQTKFDYGITLTQPGGRIRKFVEKPFWGDIFSDQVNTGIYVFEPPILNRIAPNKVVDFGKDIWPMLLAGHKPIYAHETTRYWCDVGNIQEYQKAQRDFLDGQVHFPLHGREIRPGVWAEEGTVVEPGVTFHGPCLLGKKVHVKKGARLGPYVVIGDGSHIQAKARLAHCSIWNDALVMKSATLEDCIVGHRTKVPGHVSQYGGILLAEK